MYLFAKEFLFTSAQYLIRTHTVNSIPMLCLTEHAVSIERSDVTVTIKHILIMELLCALLLHSCLAYKCGLLRRLHTQVFDLEVRQGVPLAVVFTRACPCILIRFAFPGKSMTFYQRLEAPDTHTHGCICGSSEG